MGVYILIAHPVYSQTREVENRIVNAKIGGRSMTRAQADVIYCKYDDHLYGRVVKSQTHLLCRCCLFKVQVYVCVLQMESLG